MDYMLKRVYFFPSKKSSSPIHSERNTILNVTKNKLLMLSKLYSKSHFKNTFLFNSGGKKKKLLKKKIIAKSMYLEFQTV